MTRRYNLRRGYAHRSGNLRRTARRLLVRAGVGKLKRATPFVLEWPCGSNSTITRHIAAAGGLALRICAPERLERFFRHRRGSRAAASTAPPPDPPRLRRGRILIWRLDLRSAHHRDALLNFVDTLALPAYVSAAHSHSSPPCSRACGLSPLNKSMGNVLCETADDYMERLRWVRRVHRRFRDRCRHLRVSCTRSHEQSNSCRLSYVSASQGWPWAISRSAASLSSASTVVVYGCAVGLAWKGKPVSKKWRFETDSRILLEVLALLRCPGCTDHQAICGVGGPGTRFSERYPPLLGAAIAQALLSASAA